MRNALGVALKRAVRRGSDARRELELSSSARSRSRPVQPGLRRGKLPVPREACGERARRTSSIPRDGKMFTSRSGDARADVEQRGRESHSPVREECTNTVSEAALPCELMKESTGLRVRSARRRRAPEASVGSANRPHLARQPPPSAWVISSARGVATARRRGCRRATARRRRAASRSHGRSRRRCR